MDVHQTYCDNCFMKPVSHIICSALVAQTVKRLSAMQDTQVGSLGWEDPLEKEMAAHSSILAWKIPWTVEPGKLPSVGSQRVGQDWATSLTLSLSWQLHHNKTGMKKKKEMYVILKMFLNISCGNLLKIIVLAKLTLFSPDHIVFYFLDAVFWRAKLLNFNKI